MMLVHFGLLVFGAFLWWKDRKIPNNYTGVTCVSLCSVMARPREINPTGKVRHLTARVPEPVARELEREAKREGVTVGEIIRRRLAKAS